MMNTKRNVLVTTIHRGVFAGELESRDGDFVILKNARCAILWSTKSGFLELASKGPNKDSKIGAKADRLELFGVTSIADLTPEAVKNWEARND